MGLLILIFVLALGLSFTILMLASRSAPASKSMQQRLITIQQPVHLQRANEGATLEKDAGRDYAARLGELIQHYEFSKNIEVLIVQANSDMTVGKLVVTAALMGGGGGVLALLFLHQVVFVAAGLALGAFAPLGMLKFKRSRRLKAFNEALPDAIDLLARALRAGHSISSAIELIAEQSPEPLAAEFEQVYQQQKFGLRFRESLLQMPDRVPSRDLQFLITAILVQKETGGDLTEILDRTSYVIRERVRIEGEVRTHTAQGRLTGWILGLLPVIMLALINLVSPGYSSVLFHDPTGQKMLYAGGTLIVIGGLVIRKVVDVQV